MQVILELDDCSIRVYRSFAEHIQYSSSFTEPQPSDTCTKSLLLSWTVFKTLCPKKDLKLCLRVSYNSGIILSKMFTYYSQNYAGI